MYKKLTKIKLCLVTLLFTGILPVHAIDAYTSGLYREIDIAFYNKSDTELGKILGSNADSLNYYLLENYTMKKIRHLLIDEEYQFALQANLVVIDNDLDNVDAVELYTVISSALDNQKKMQAAAEEKRKIELAKFEQEKEKKLIEVEKDFNSVVTPEGKMVFVNDKHERLTSNYWNIRFGMADLGLITHSFANPELYNGSYRAKEVKNADYFEQDSAEAKQAGSQYIGGFDAFKSEYDSSYASARYGINIDFTYEYAFDKLMVGVDANAEALLIPIVKSSYTEHILPKTNEDYFDFGPRRSADMGILINFAALPKIGLTTGRYTIYGRGGILSMFNSCSDDYNFISKTFITPVLGFGCDRLKLKHVTLSGNVDYYIGHMFADYAYNFACGADFNVSLPIGVMERFSMNLNFGIKETLIAKNEGIENRARLILAIGAENVGKK